MSLISEIAQGYQNIGTAKAQGQAASGQIWGQTLANLGQIPAQIQQIKHQQQADALQGMELEGKRREMAAQDALNNAMSTALKPDGSIDLDKISKSLAGTPAAYKFADVSAHVASMQQSHANLLKANQEVAKSEADQIGALAAAADVYDDPHDKAGVLLAGIASGIKGGSISAEHGKAVIASLLGSDGQPDPAAVNQKIAEMKALSKEQQELGLKRTDDARMSAVALETIRHNQASEALTAEDRDRSLAAQQETARHNRQSEATATYRAQHPAAASGMQGDDIDAIVDGIISGEQPPTLQGLYRNGAAVRAGLAKKGYNLATAQTDWAATQKHVATLNGAQQTRMAQAIDNAGHSLDVIEDLAKQWDGGRFPILNKATLAAAKHGAMGANAQQIATKLEAQIADVTSELANVYMGGNSPTDHALDLASKNLQANWTRDQLRSAINLSRKNLQIRANSMKNTGVAGASAGNAYQPPTAGAPTEGATKPIPGYPGTEQTFKNGKWIRTK